MPPIKYKITLDQLRMAARSASRKVNPCFTEIDRITNAMEAADYNIRPLWKYVKDLEDCYDRNDKEDSKGRASTLYYLSKYLDRQKTKKK